MSSHVIFWPTPSPSSDDVIYEQPFTEYWGPIRWIMSTSVGNPEVCSCFITTNEVHVQLLREHDMDYTVNLNPSQLWEEAIMPLYMYFYRQDSESLQCQFPNVYEGALDLFIRNMTAFWKLKKFTFKWHQQGMQL